jgi:DNA-directed RNA polymerase specialized sigma24 family protein
VANPTSSISRTLNALFATYLQDPENGLEPLIAKVRSIAKRTYHDDDMAQQFAMMVWQSLPKLTDIPCSFGGWVYRRLQWRRIDFIRALQPILDHESQAPEMVGEDGESLTDDESFDILAFNAMDAGAELDLRLETISDPFVQSVAQHLIEGHTQDEIADRLGVKPSTLRSRLLRYRHANEAAPELMAA